MLKFKLSNVFFHLELTVLVLVATEVLYAICPTYSNYGNHPCYCPAPKVEQPRPTMVVGVAISN